MIGIDIVYIPRIEQLMARHGDRFLDRICSEEDKKALKNRRPEHLAGIFAAKEAMGKALGEGIFSPGLRALSVRRGDDGAPYGVFRGREFFLSISHEKDYAISVALLKEAGGPRPDPEMARLLPELNKTDHKGSRGRAAVVGGSLGMFGSVDLATRAALRSGAGLVYAVLDDDLVPSFALRAMEVIVKGREDLSFLRDMDAVAVGPGLGRGDTARRVFESVLDRVKGPLLIDADGLFHLAEGGPRPLGEQVVLTPHAGEMARLIKRDVNWVNNNREAATACFLERYGGTVVLKGHQTIIRNRDRIVYNPTGNAGMATAGSGDVLTGIITALLAQGLSCFDGARLGVYIHGFSGDLGALHKGPRSLIASDVIEHLGEAFQALDGQAEGI